MSGRKAAAPAEAQQAQAAKILQRCVCLTLQLHYLGNNRTVSVEDLVDAAGGDKAVAAQRLEAEQFHAVKKLLPDKELRHVTRPQQKMRSLLRGKAISAHRVFGDRTYLIPLAMVAEVVADLQALKAEMRAEAHKLAHERYGAAMLAQKAKVGTLWRAADYLEPAAVEAAFGAEWHFVRFDAPENLESVDAAIYADEARKHERRWASMHDEARLVLRQMLLETAGKVAEKLAPGEDGKPKVFKDTVLDKLTAFFETFKARDLTDDAELERVVATLRKATKGVGAQDLRDAEGVRLAVLATVRQAAQQLDGMVATGRRGFGLSAA